MSSDVPVNIYPLSYSILLVPTPPYSDGSEQSVPLTEEKLIFSTFCLKAEYPFTFTTKQNKTIIIKKIIHKSFDNVATEYQSNNPLILHYEV
jgi:hypothetical protein